MDSEKHMSIELLKKIDCADVSKISYRDLYFRFWACRDFEIAHVWHRAIFLTAFLIACFAGYGTILLSMLGKDVPNLVIVNGVAFCVTVIGVVVSVLWIMMAKGSKMWYERWESAIEAFRKSERYKDAFEDGVSSIAGMKHDDIEGFNKPNLSDCIFSTNGGNYSVSRINVFIGQFSFLIWCVLMLVHLVCAFSLGSCHLNMMEHCKTLLMPIMLLVAALVSLIWFWCCVVPCIKGGSSGSCVLPFVKWVCCKCLTKTGK